MSLLIILYINNNKGFAPGLEDYGFLKGISHLLDNSLKLCDKYKYAKLVQCSGWRLYLYVHMNRLLSTLCYRIAVLAPYPLRTVFSR